MKKTGIINARLMKALTGLGHTDRMVICDAGFPTPVGVPLIDLALICGVPGFLQTLRVVLNELVVEEYGIFAAMEEKNPEFYAAITNILHRQTAEKYDFTEFVAQSHTAKFILRTGELAPCSNIILVSASGVPRMVEKYNVMCD